MEMRAPAGTLMGPWWRPGRSSSLPPLTGRGEGGEGRAVFGQGRGGPAGAAVASATNIQRVGVWALKVIHASVLVFFGLFS